MPDPDTRATPFPRPTPELIAAARDRQRLIERRITQARRLVERLSLATAPEDARMQELIELAGVLYHLEMDVTRGLTLFAGSHIP